MIGLSLKYVLDNIKKGSWYKQGGAILTFFITYVYPCMYKELGTDHAFVIQKGTWNAGYFEKSCEKKKAELYLKKYLKDTGFLDKRIKAWKKGVKNQQEKLKLITRLKFDENKRLKRFIKKYSGIAVKTWNMSMVIEVFDPWGDNLIKEYASRYGLTEDEISILTSPDKLTYLQEELIERHKIAGSKQSRKIKQHYDRYYWYLTSWQHAKITDEKHFERSIKGNLAKEVKKILDHKKDIEKRKKQIIKKHRIDAKTQKVFRFFTELNDWRDIRKKEAVCKINYDLWLFLKKLAKYNKIGLDLASHIVVHELNSFKLSKSYIRTLKKRAKGYYVMYYNKNGSLRWAYGKDAETILKALENRISSELREIKGRIAYPGSVKARVKVVNSISEFSKIKKGDILVSVMTRPEMMPVMKKAAAIITDEGGITCHAAIVSRELKIPCIVGTQIATSSLKDGDLVEVNGATGVIKLIR